MLNPVTKSRELKSLRKIKEPSRRKAKMIQLVGKGVSMAEIARAQNISRQRIWQICRYVRADN